MILKVIIFAIVGLLVYKFFGGKLPSFKKSASQKKLDDDTLVECAKCSTYVTVKESDLIQGKYYCSKECRP
ncbi:MAG: PP0621 family protein [Campylobacterota bacterium]|nr:PP0621 family protein [Campylobacterota bacterium]